MSPYGQVIVGAWIVFLVFLFGPLLFKRVPADRTSQSYLKRSILVVLLAVAVAIVLSQAFPRILSLRIVPDDAAAGIAGVVLTLAGLGFSAWARIHLGRFWSSMVMIKVGHQLVRTGPYRFVRNPMYTGILTAWIGAAIAIGVLGGFYVLGVVLAAIWVKIRSEEEILLGKFGEEYLKYRKDVKAALIPFLV